MAKELVINYRDVLRSIAFHLNAINAALIGKVDSSHYNAGMAEFQNSLRQFNDLLNGFEIKFDLYDGMHFVTDQPAQKIMLKNHNNQTITETNVAWLNNEGTTFYFNPNTNNLELKNDAGEVLSVVPVSAFVTNIGNVLTFNPINKFILELRDNSGVVKSGVEINIENVKNLQNLLNSLQTLYLSDGTLSSNRTVTLTDKFLKFVTNGDTVEINQNKLIVPQLHTNKFSASHNSNLLTPTLNGNLPYLELGSNSIERLTYNAKNHSFKNVKINDTTANKTLVINDNGDIMFQNGVLASYTAGEGIKIENNVISLIPTDRVELVFEW